MKFEKDLVDGYRIHAYDSNEIILAIPFSDLSNESENVDVQSKNNFYHATDSFIVARETLIKTWPLANIALLDKNHLTPVHELKPELVLLGTGQKQQFPDMQLLSTFYNQGIGVEVMDSPAACRTFNILAGEGRKVVAAIIIDH